jgi:cytochrome c553
MNSKNLTAILFLGAIALVFSVVAYAGTEVKDMIRMENKAYTKHTKSVMDFSHKKHTEDYKAGCGECHHDKDNKPLNNLKIGDEVQNCIECHKKAGMIKGKEAKGLTDAQKREYHANAIHQN